MPRVLWSLLALGAIGAAGCARHRPRPPPDVPGAGDVAIGGVTGAQAVSLAVVPPYTNERCREGRAFIAGGGAPAMTMVDLPCLERGDCGPTATRTATAAGAADRVIGLRDYSILAVRVGRQMKAGRAVGAAFVARSTDCGDTWTTSIVDADALDHGASGGGWDRLVDAYADPWDLRGLVYLAVDASEGGERRAVILWSNDLANPGSWRAQAVVGRAGAGDWPVAMAAPAAGRLYLLDVVGTSPRITPIRIDPEAAVLSVLPSWYVFQRHGSFDAAPDSTSWDDRATPAGGSLGLAASGRVANFDRLIGVYQSGRFARVLNIGVTGASAVTSVEIIPLMTVASDHHDGRVARATLVEGAPASTTTGLSWVDQDPAAGRARTRWAGFIADPRNLATRPDPVPAPASTDGEGAPRVWAIAGDAPARGTGYRGSGGFAGFLFPWIEGGAPRALHVKAGRVAPMMPWEVHAFDQTDDRWYADGGDWAWYRLKGDCSSSSVMVGLSANENGGSAHSMLCHNHLVPMLAPSSVAVPLSVGAKSRDSLPDWDPDAAKADCAEDEAVTGVAQTHQGRVTTIRCTRMGGAFHRNKCDPRMIGDVFNRGSMAPDDWAPKTPTIQCLSGQILKGVSTKVPSGAVHAILCCYISVM